MHLWRELANHRLNLGDIRIDTLGYEVDEFGNVPIDRFCFTQADTRPAHGNCGVDSVPLFPFMLTRPRIVGILGTADCFLHFKFTWSCNALLSFWESRPLGAGEGFRSPFTVPSSALKGRPSRKKAGVSHA